MAARSFPLPLLGLVHTSIDIARLGPLAVDDRPELTVHAARLRPHRRGTEVEMVTRARLAGRLVWEDRSTYLARHKAAAGARTAEPEASGPPLPKTQEWRLPADLGRRHARVSGDYNPIHLHALTARPLGFRRAIAHGMWTVARCAAASPSCELTRLTADFRRPVLLPALVVYAAAGPRFEVRSSAGLHLTGARQPC